MKRDQAKKNGKACPGGDIEAAAASKHDNVDSKQQERLLKSSFTNNSKGNKTMLAQQETLSENDKQNLNKTQQSSCCLFRKLWILILILMATALILAAIIVAILPQLDNEDQCFNNYAFPQPGYKLFTTKTTYSTAFNYLNSAHSDGNSRAQLPNLFSSPSTLKQLDDHLKSKQCQAKQIHFFGRHAARYPSSEDIDDINKLIESIQLRIDLSKITVNNKLNATNSNSTSIDVCFNPLTQYKQWDSFLIPQQDNLVMGSGIEETTAIARRLKSIYPNLFDGVKANISFKTTKALRTAQTAVAFLKNVDNFTLPHCSFSDFTVPASQLDKSTAEKLKSNQCFKKFLSDSYDDRLIFHENCKILSKENVTAIEPLNLTQPIRTAPIANSVSKKLRLNKQDSLTQPELKAIYNLCRFESATSGESIWCNLFSEDDLKFLEYLDDIRDYLEATSFYKSACPITSDLLRLFKSIDSSKSLQSEAKFYFTHSEVIRRILAFTFRFETDEAYYRENILPHLDAGTVPDHRQWRSSLFSPFSANIAFTLYECPATKQNVPDLKIVASLNERPVEMEGCTNSVCDLREFVSEVRWNEEKQCRLDQVCRKNYVIQ